MNSADVNNDPVTAVDICDAVHKAMVLPADL